MSHLRGVSILLLIMLLLAVAACAPASNGAAGTGSAGKIGVVASISILGDMVKNVGGDRINVQVLVPVGADPHTFDPTPADIKSLSQAQIIFVNGAGLESWLDKLIKNVAGDHPVIAVSKGIPPLKGDEQEPEGDPHMWFDAGNAIHYVEQIRDGLSQVDPQGAAIYKANAEKYIAQLQELDGFIETQIKTLPSESRKLVTNHDTFGYYAKRYGMEVAGTVFDGVTPEKEPSPQDIAMLVQKIKAQKIKAIFAENTINPKLAEQIAQEAGVQVVTNLYTDSLGAPGSDGDTYIKMMRYDTLTIVNALK